jgi:putative membrane protein insertion efficiency factor
MLAPRFAKLHSPISFARSGGRYDMSERLARGLRRARRALIDAPRNTVILALVFYKGAISPYLPTCCKYHPSCSAYAREAVERHGVGRGLWLALKRLLRCRPFVRGGYDPVPDA